MLLARDPVPGVDTPCCGGTIIFFAGPTLRYLPPILSYNVYFPCLPDLAIRQLGVDNLTNREEALCKQLEISYCKDYNNNPRIDNMYSVEAAGEAGDPLIPPRDATQLHYRKFKIIPKKNVFT